MEENIERFGVVWGLGEGGRASWGLLRYTDILTGDGFTGKKRERREYSL